MSYVGDLIIPIIEWEKKLIPQGDSDQLDVIDRLAEKGVPFSLRTMAAAGGYSLDQLTRELEKLDIFGEEDSGHQEEAGEGARPAAKAY